MLKVSVTILTYNQAKFIGQTIESALAQQTDFDYEILVGDDCSTDGARDIIADYERRYPGKVRAVLHPRNLGQNGLFNTIETLKLAQGQYIAALDGDDYWTDPLKLQKQVDFLDAHPHFSACFHNARITYEMGKGPARPGMALLPDCILNPPDQKAVVTVEDLVGEDEIWFMATSAVLFRNGLMHYPDWFLKSSSGDIPRYIILAKNGPIGYLPDVMSVYRKNPNGASFQDNYRDPRFLLNRISMYKGINGELGHTYDGLLRKNIARYYRMLLDVPQYEDQYVKRAGTALTYLKLARPAFAERKEIVRDYVLPKWARSIYSFLALLPHRLNGSAQ